MAEKLRSVEPVKLTTTDGQERSFLLTMGGIRRLKTRFGFKILAEFLNQDAEAVGVPLLFEALLDKGDLSEEQFAELLPAHLDAIAEVIAALLGASFPDRPTKASEQKLETLQ